MGKADGPFQKVRPDLPDDPKFRRMVTVLRAEPDFAAFVLGVPVAEDGDWPRTVGVGGAERTCWDVSDLVPAPVAGAVLLMGLLRVWGAAYAARSGEVLAGLTVPEIDDLGGVPGLCVAMCDVGWAEQMPGPAVRFPGLADFFRGARAASGADRTAAWRERARAARGDETPSNVVTPVTATASHNVTPVTTCDENVTAARRSCDGRVTGKIEDGREKIEDKELRAPEPGSTRTDGKKKRAGKFDPTTTTIPAELDTTEFRQAWAMWCADRKVRGFDLTKDAVRLQMAKLVGWGPAGAVRSIEQAIERGWRSVFPPKGDDAGRGAGTGDRGRTGGGDYSHLASHNVPAPALPEGPRPAGTAPAEDCPF